ncbi:MAG: EamA family transporter RarD [Woeseia sp.]
MSSNTAPVTETPEASARNGVLAALAAFSMWGFLPIYFKVTQHVPAFEILAHRIVWAIPFGVLIIVLRRQWPEVRRAIRHRRTLSLLIASSLFIAVNWFVYIWAVQQSQIFQASLGYYINPLMYVVIGVFLFGDTLRRVQILAVVLATIGVGVLTFSGGQFPLISIVLATSFTFYGGIRKKTDVGAMPGLFIETSILLPLALGYVIYIVNAGTAVFANNGTSDSLWLVLAGPLTVLPLLCFALAARRLTLSTVGFMQFLAPTLQFIVGIAYGETLSTAHLICFGFIWSAVLLFSLDAWRSSRVRVPVPQPG